MKNKLPPMKRRFVTDDEAKPAKAQHRKPCADCPWARTALHGWLGSGTVDSWLANAHGEAMIPCHTSKGAQCAGAATFRANVFKQCCYPEALQLPRDTARVFASDAEFRAHHTT